MRKHFILLFSFWILLVQIACDSDIQKSLPIAPVSNITFEPGNGSILFRWDPPAVPVSSTEISYTDENGVERRALVSGKLSECLLNGFGSSDVFEFRFITRNAEGQTSEAISMFAAPLEPYMNIFNGKVKIAIGLGGIQVQWDNEYDTEFYVEIKYSDVNGNEYKKEIMVPVRHSGSQFINIASNLAGSQGLDIFITTTDIYGNVSSPNVIRFFKVESGLLDRSRWKVAAFSSEDAVGKAVNVLDGLSETYWSSSQHAFPNHYLTFDLGSRKRLEMVELQQRQDIYMAGGIEIWGNNQSATAADGAWINIASINLNINSKDAQLFAFPTPVEFRYVKIQFKTPGTDAQNAGLAEFWLYGADILE